MQSQIRKNADRLLALINDIIQLSELDHQEVIHEFAHVDLYEIAKRMRAIAERQCAKEKCGDHIQRNELSCIRRTAYDP